MIQMTTPSNTAITSAMNVNAHPGFIAWHIGIIAAEPPALIIHLAKLTAAVAAAGLSRWRSRSKPLVILNAPVTPKPMMNRATSGPTMCVRYLSVQPKISTPIIPMMWHGIRICRRTRSMGKLVRSCCLPLDIVIPTALA